jgi:hypothetical protein
MQTVIVIIIVAACALFIGRRFYNNLRKSKSGCNCSCSGCGPEMQASCQAEQEPDRTANES